MKRQRFYRLIHLAQNTDIYFNEKTAKLHNWPKTGSQLLVQWTTSYFLSYKDCHHIPAAVCLQHRDHRVSKIFPKLRLLPDPVTTRSDMHACVKTTPQRTRFRDVQQAIIMATV